MRDYKYEHGAGVTKSFTKSTILGIVAFILLFMVIGSVWARQWYVSSLAPLESESTELIQVDIENGSTAIEIANQLEQEKVIRDATAFRLYGYFNDSLGELQAGLYEFSPSMSVERIMQLIVDGKVATRNITLLSGLRLEEIKAVMIDNGFLPDEIDQAFNAEYDSFVYQLKPEGKSLEGFIYPDTYEITNNTSPRDLVKQALDNFDQKVDENLIADLNAQGLDFYEALTLGSIVHKEVTEREDKRKVSQVFLTRLERGMPLGADPTFKYAAAIAGVEPTTSIESPYNTRQVTGLTPTPIGNLTIDTLEAVANPTDTDYLYFVSGDDGITRFSRTLEEHEANIDQYCDELCRQ